VATYSLDVRHPYALEETLLGGQAFRWRKAGDQMSGFVGNVPVILRGLGAEIEVKAPDGAHVGGEVARYLRLDDPMPSIYRAISKDDHIRGAVGRWRGLHLLAQEPWEATVAFIASSASNLAKISRSIEKMCRRFGDEVEFDGKTWHTLPTPEVLARARLADLKACEFGYRARYLQSTARAVADGEVNLARIGKLPTDEAQKALVDGLDGIGPKVAACILLFSMGKDDAFPVDRHIQRAVSEMYFGGRKLTDKACEEWGRKYFGRWAGYGQQYLFHERRTGARKTRAA
jgi:N-glycosylase/DNA lyase